MLQSFVVAERWRGGLSELCDSSFTTMTSEMNETSRGGTDWSTEGGRGARSIYSFMFGNMWFVDNATINKFLTCSNLSLSLVDMLILLSLAAAIPTSAMAGHWIEMAGSLMLRRRQTNESK